MKTLIGIKNSSLALLKIYNNVEIQLQEDSDTFLWLLKRLLGKRDWKLKKYDQCFTSKLLKQFYGNQTTIFKKNYSGKGNRNLLRKFKGKEYHWSMDFLKTSCGNQLDLDTSWLMKWLKIVQKLRSSLGNFQEKTKGISWTAKIAATKELIKSSSFAIKETLVEIETKPASKLSKSKLWKHQLQIVKKKPQEGTELFLVKLLGQKSRNCWMIFKNPVTASESWLETIWGNLEETLTSPLCKIWGN